MRRADDSVASALSVAAGGRTANSEAAERSQSPEGDLPGSLTRDAAHFASRDPGVEVEPVDLDQLFEWEFWKGDSPFWVHAASGSCAGVFEHCLIYPFDTIKTRIQAAPTGGAVSLSWRTWREARYMFRGLPAICAGCVPAHAALFSVYELTKARLGTDSYSGSAICGALSTASHDAILTPSDVVKQRLQLGCYRNTWHCCRTVWAQEGYAAFYRSFGTTLAMNIPFGAIFVAVNEALRRLRPVGSGRGASQPDNRTQSPPGSSSGISGKVLTRYFLSAATAGGIAGACTTPLDVIKTRLQTQDVAIRSTGVRTTSKPWPASEQFPPQPEASGTAGATALHQNHVPDGRKTGVEVTGSFPTQQTTTRHYQRRLLSSGGTASGNGYTEVVGSAHSTGPSQGLDLKGGFLRGASLSAPSRRASIVKSGGSRSTYCLCSPFVLSKLAYHWAPDRSCTPRYTNFFNTARIILQEEGWWGFWKGMSARVIVSAPSAAICWGTYETAKMLLTRSNVAEQL